ncbi:AI-2E family transporter [Salinimonas marina]|uniref:AI-2E family transporter n=1 Tax=Salinimonas marina TaxID=2785918 RepID=A0A7S9HEF3_9ALTE|nr:AI-2E family transporter [Salinimonas marina]QPG06832.1 AI-2E family transporter [Salinimonas marina]
MGLFSNVAAFYSLSRPWLAAAFPLALAFAIDPGWSKFFMALGLFLSLEIISNNIIEPWLYGVSTGTSNFALMVAAVFWTWLWGPVGLFLSTPLTVCVVVLGKYVPSLNFISVLLGSVPALKPHERLYQRMLAMDYDEMLYLSHTYLKEHSLAEYFDQLLMPALNLAEVDRHQEDLADIRYTFILQNVPELLDELDPAEIPDKETEPQAETIEDHSSQSLTAAQCNRVVVVPAKEGIGELSAQILATFLKTHNISSQLAAANNFAAEFTRQPTTERPALVCVTGLPPDAFMPARRLCRRLNKIDDTLACVLGVWSPDIEAQELQKRIPSTVNTTVVTSLAQCLEAIRTQLGQLNVTSQADTPADIPAVDSLQ